MFSRIRNRFTFTNVLLVVALLFTMTGGAYAAKKYLITSTKQISPSVLKALQGKVGINGAPGAQGPAGAQGVPGAQGPAGKGEKGEPGPAGKGERGEPGTVGRNGESVTSKAFSGAKTIGSQKCTEGGTELTSSSGTTLACNGEAGNNGKEGATGKEGSPWTDGGTLPSGATETGVWTLVGEPVELAGAPTLFGSISFPIQLKEGLPASLIGFEAGEGEAKEKLPVENGKKICKGDYKKPEAEPGHLCVFVGGSAPENIDEDPEAVLFPITLEPNPSLNETNKTGAEMIAIAKNANAGVYAIGSWAVTEK